MLVLSRGGKLSSVTACDQVTNYCQCDYSNGAVSDLEVTRIGAHLLVCDYSLTNVGAGWLAHVAVRQCEEL